MIFLKPTGEVLCKWSSSGWWPSAISGDGQWLGFKKPGKVDVWRMQDLGDACLLKPLTEDAADANK